MKNTKQSSQPSLEDLIGGKPEVTTRDFTKAKATDVFFLHFNGSRFPVFGTPVVARLLLPPGKYIVVAQTLLINGGDAAKSFGGTLTYPNDTGTARDATFGTLTPNFNGLPFNVLLNCAVSIAAGQALEFSIGSSATDRFIAENIKITAVRVPSLAATEE